VEVYAADWVIPVDGSPIERGGVGVHDGRIVAVGLAEELRGERENFPDSVIVPGFVNAHTHLENAAFAGLGDGLPFGEWLRRHAARSRGLDWDDRIAMARLGASECLASGATTIGDASYSGAAAVAASEVGLRAIVYLEVFGAGTDHIHERFETNRERIADALSDRVRVGVSPHTPYTAGAALYAAALDLGVPVSTHFAESTAEREWLVDGKGPWARDPSLLVSPLGETGIRSLARAGLLTGSIIAAHCVDVDDEEIGLLAGNDVAVAHCPRSNAMLGCGIAPIAELRAAGVRIGLGTDSPSSAVSFDMFDEMRAAILVSRARSGRADALSAGDALRLATLGSAEALELEHEVGSLTPGKRADLAIVSLAGSAFLPWDDPAVALVLGGAPWRVCRTIVDGTTRYSTGGHGWHELRRNAQSARARMLGSRSSRP
jgi:cytosine/adenosine deaminase-related metal-dependent hydrolase